MFLLGEVSEARGSFLPTGLMVCFQEAELREETGLTLCPRGETWQQVIATWPGAA